ncbi:lysophospholipid acyltransferase family protein [Pararobbsia silviterrae]|uniref:1-acyl-sn-glycerol-3-phosphate acyltransferase n=1 Tax=Pararobbsia silviterrae TaxID=1792498 RepID=A0A494Y8Q3_9BURK|nr:lysophospholipid acyltransferase family protein [Pararobbsia silviterrae]RKP59061.1 1-acyl-sn-glycerol-3-phosphate acyltransferase [Pararobbsia silviterrae]
MSHSLRKARIVLHIARGVLLAATVFQRASAAKRQDLIRAWSRHLLHLCGMKLVVHGDAHTIDAGTLVVGNHVSWIDIYVVNAWRPTPFVAKSEIAKWPVIGWLAKTIGTVFIEREKRGDARRIMHHLASELSAGRNMFVFPEGTTSDGQGLLPFHSNLFQAAVSAGAPVQPVAMVYKDAAGNPTRAPAYIDDMNLLDTLNAMLDAAPLEVHLYVGEGIEPGAQRRELSAMAEATIGAALDAMRRGSMPVEIDRTSASVVSA